MNELTEQTIQCPYCWESISVLIDPSVDEQEYTEDCQVCCRPIIFQVTIEMTGEVSVSVKSEDD